MAEDLTTADFHNVVQKQMLNVVFDTLSQAKLDWAQVEPFLSAARQVCRSDFAATGRARILAVQAEGDNWVEAEEAYLAISASDREDGVEWLSETWWLSDLVLAEHDRAQAEAIIAALERSISKIRQGLENGGGLAGDSTLADEAS
jgi:hypothetical protein